MPSKNSWIADRLVKYRYVCLLVAGVLSVLSYVASEELAIDHSIESMFVRDDPVLDAYRQLKRTFGGNEIVMAVYTDPELFAEDGSGLRRLAEVSERCQEVRGVKSVLTIDRLLSGSGIPLNSNIGSSLRAMFEGYTHGQDGETVAITCMLETDDAAVKNRSKTITDLRAIMDTLPSSLEPGFVAGEPVMVVDGFRYLRDDGRRLGLLSTILLSLTILLCFRKLLWVIVPLLVVQWSRLTTSAIMTQAGLRLSMVSATLTAILTVIGVATVVHVAVRYRDARRDGLQPHDALRRAAALLIAPVFWACVTDAVAFLALTSADVGPVRDYGIMMCIGSLQVLMAVALIVPAIVLAWPPAEVATTWGEKQIGRMVIDLNTWVAAHSRLVTSVALLVLATAVGGLAQLEVETDFIRNFRADSPLVKSYRMIESRLGGAGVLDILLPAPAELDADYLTRVSGLQERLRTEVVVGTESGATRPGLTRVISLADTVDVMKDVTGGGSAVGGLLSTARQSLIGSQLGNMLARRTADTMVKVTLAMVRNQMPQFSHAMHAEDPQQPGRYYFRIMLRTSEQQSAAAKQQLIDRIDQLCQEEFPAEDPDSQPQVTGFFVLLTNLIQSVISDQWLTLGVATVGIALTLSIAFGSIRYALLSLVPNLLPVVLVMGLLGWLGLRINMGAAMVTAVSLGLSVDGSIHFVQSFRRSLNEGLSVDGAIEVAQRTVGRAAVLATLALVVGFLVLSISDFVPTVYFGVLVSLAMAGGLVGNLMLLPLLLRTRAGVDEP